MRCETHHRFDTRYLATWISVSLIVFLQSVVAVRAQTPAGQAEPSRPAQVSVLPVVRTIDHLGPQSKKQFSRFGQCQISFGLKLGPNQTQIARQPSELKQRLYDCFEIAAAEDVNVLILPELAFALPDELQREVLTRAKNLAMQKKMVIVAGSYYDERRYNRLIVIGENWTETGFKIRPSRFEVSPIADEGMTPGESLLVLKTIYGTFAIITCVDLISDDVQYLVRQLATRGEIDVLININWNPAAWEFLVEANSIVRRHPIFATITNIANPGPACSRDPKDTTDNGRCYGNTAVFANLRAGPDDAPPNNADRISEALPPHFTNPANRKTRLLPYDQLVASITPFKEAMLIYDLNLRLNREPVSTNAPDQGYPTIKNIKIVDLKPRLSQ